MEDAMKGRNVVATVHKTSIPVLTHKEYQTGRDQFSHKLITDESRSQ